MKLHLGCGKRDFGSEWVHIDAGDFPHLHSHNITTLPFEDNTADLIYASHVIEYFDREEIIPVLQEWRRVLKPGGVLRLAVPNFLWLAFLYSEEDYDLDYLLGPLYGKIEIPGVRRSGTIYHKTVYDRKHLSKVLASCLFTNIRTWDWRNTEHSHIDDHSQAYLPHMNKETGKHISLNIECEKPQ